MACCLAGPVPPATPRPAAPPAAQEWPGQACAGQEAWSLCVLVAGDGCVCVLVLAHFMSRVARPFYFPTATTDKPHKRLTKVLHVCVGCLCTLPGASSKASDCLLHTRAQCQRRGAPYLVISSTMTKHEGTYASRLFCVCALAYFLRFCPLFGLRAIHARRFVDCFSRLSRAFLILLALFLHRIKWNRRWLRKCRSVGTKQREANTNNGMLTASLYAVQMSFFSSSNAFTGCASFLLASAFLSLSPIRLLCT